MQLKNKKNRLFHKRRKSFDYAFNGLALLFKNEVNSRIHLLAAGMVVAAGAYFHIELLQWTVLVICIAAVFTAELINTAIEKTIDLVSPEKNIRAGNIKDLSAAAVLVTASGAFICGLLVFIPYLKNALHF
jgi:diacylglycerol kinase